MARPRKKIDWKTVDGLLGIQCTLAEISSVLDVSEDTIERACKREMKSPFADYSKHKRLKGNVSLRRKQFELAVGGNVTLLIWLGKNILDQRDQPEPKMPDESEFYENVARGDETLVHRGVVPWEMPPGATPATAIDRPDDEAEYPPGSTPGRAIDRPLH